VLRHKLWRVFLGYRPYIQMAAHSKFILLAGKRREKPAMKEQKPYWRKAHVLPSTKCPWCANTTMHSRIAIPANTPARANSGKILFPIAHPRRLEVIFRPGKIGRSPKPTAKPPATKKRLPILIARQPNVNNIPQNKYCSNSDSFRRLSVTPSSLEASLLTQKTGHGTGVNVHNPVQEQAF